MSSKTALASSIQALLKLSENELEGELGRRLSLTAEELEHDQMLTVANATGPTIDQETLKALPDFTRKVAERFLKRFNHQMFSLICDRNDPDNEKARSAAAQGVEVFAYVI